jgi:hypothetical protein
MKEYNIGDTVWVPRAEYRDIIIPCPICFTKGVVHLILGDDSVCELACDYCRDYSHYPHATGYVKERAFVQKAESYVVTGKNVSYQGNEVKISYQSNYYSLSSEDLFDTMEEAFDKSKEKAKELQDAYNYRTEHIKHDVKKKFSWNAGYHLRQVKEKTKEIERHLHCAKICKERSKETK